MAKGIFAGTLGKTVKTGKNWQNPYFQKIKNDK